MISLFFSSFLAATILPISSEVHLAYLANSEHSKISLLLVASSGNFLGGMSCYLLGHLGKWEWLSKYFKIKNETIVKYKSKLESFKGWPALFCWFPVVGDPIAVTYGLMKAPLLSFSIYMFAGKFLRYLFVIYITGLF